MTMPKGKDIRKPLITGSRQERGLARFVRDRVHYTCEGCGLSYLKYDWRAAARAGLCKACYYEKKQLYGCACPRITGDEERGVYACSLCPETTGHTPMPFETPGALIHQACLELGVQTQ
jgi:hypothetical protein